MNPHKYLTQKSFGIVIVVFRRATQIVRPHNYHRGNTASSTISDSSYSVTDTYAYDAQHNPVTHILGGSTLAYAYDLQFNRTVISPSNAVATSYAYDDFGRIKKRASPFTGTTTYQYDAAGNLTSKTDGNGATTATTYDALNRPLQAVSSRTGLSSETVTWTYDDTTSGHFGIGRLASMTDPSGSTTYTYERHGFIASQVQVAGGSTYTTSYAYDGNGNRSSVTLPSTRVLTYTFDYADRPESVVSGTTNYVTSAAYEPFGPLSQIVFGNGVTQTRTFTQRYLLAEDKITNSTSTLADQTFVENAAGYITGITDAVNAGYDESMAYGGRATNMLTTVRTGSALWTLAQYSDTFNQNLSSIAFPGSNLGLNYNRAGQLTSIYNQDTNTSQTVTEDGAGNELAVGSSSYTYSPRNLLSTGDGVTYHYDGFGRRVSATATAGTRVSLYDPSMHLQTESALSSGAIAYDYVWFAGIPVAQEDIGGNTHWTATDYRGAAYLQTNSSGAAYWQADYAPFGAVYALRTSDVHQPLRLPGQEAEEFAAGNANGYTGRFYNGFRWYRPTIGRYTQADPLDYDGKQMSLSTYSANNPINYSDISGLVVYLDFQPIPQAPIFYHGYLRAIPNNQNDFCGNSRFKKHNGELEATFSGEPANGPSVFNFGPLISAPNEDINGGISDQIVVNPPSGMSDTAFINQIISLDNNYRGQEFSSIGMIGYNPIGQKIFQAQNSNSYYMGLIDASGGSLSQQPNVLNPGSGNPVSENHFR